MYSNPEVWREMERQYDNATDLDAYTDDEDLDDMDFAYEFQRDDFPVFDLG